MSELIVKDNVLINASYNLDLVEQRLILLAIVEARESGKGINANDPLTIHAETYINQFGVHRTTAYQSLKDACKDLFARQFSYQDRTPKGNPMTKMSRWVSEVGYADNEAIVTLIFAPAIVPLITRLEEEFTRYDIDQISGLSSAYAVRLYELLIQWRSAGKTPIIELQEFRKRLGVLDTEYQRMDVLKKGVLDLSITQINAHTDITATYEQHKSGRLITGFSFKFKQKAKAVLNKKPCEPSAKGVPPPDISAFAGLDLQLLKTIQKQYPEINEQYVINLAKQAKIDVLTALNRIKIEYQNPDSFTLAKTE
jgi:plasmid replication initiation protein